MDQLKHELAAALSVMPDLAVRAILSRIITAYHHDWKVGPDGSMSTTRPVRLGGPLSISTLDMMALFRRLPISFTDFPHIAQGIFAAAAVIATGTAPLVAGEAGRLGLTGILSHATTANSGANLGTAVNTLMLGGGEVYEVSFRSYPATGLGGAICRTGFHTSATHADAANGVYCEIIDGILVGKTAKASVRSTTPTNYALGLNVWYRLQVALSQDYTTATFYLYDSVTDALLWTDSLSANLPLLVLGARHTATFNAPAIATGIHVVDYLAVSSYTPR